MWMRKTRAPEPCDGLKRVTRMTIDEIRRKLSKPWEPKPKEKAEKPKSFRVILENCGNKKIIVIKTIMDHVSGLSLYEAKKITDIVEEGIPQILISEISESEAKSLSEARSLCEALDYCGAKTRMERNPT